jgi:hypothetical protein
MADACVYLMKPVILRYREFINIRTGEDVTIRSWLNLIGISWDTMVR